MTQVTLIAPRRTLAQRRALQRLTADVLAIAGGFSSYPGFGAWRGPDGRVIREKHTRLEIATDSPRKVLAAFKRYGQVAGERSLLYLTGNRGRMIAA